MVLVAAAACGQEERISVPAAGVHGDGQQSQLEIQIRVGRVRPYQITLLFFFITLSFPCLTDVHVSSPPSYRQLILIIELYSHFDVYDYLRQIALTLCSDKVSEVRWISYKLVSGRY